MCCGGRRGVWAVLQLCGAGALGYLAQVAWWSWGSGAAGAGGGDHAGGGAGGEGQQRERNCTLPAYGVWCSVAVYGLPEFAMAVYRRNDIVSRAICSTGVWGSVARASDLLPFGPPGFALDIGGNVGYFSLVLAQAGWEVLTFEPHVKNVALMRATLCRNPDLASRITLRQEGLGLERSHCRLISSTTNTGDTITRCGKEINASLDPNLFRDMTYRDMGGFDVHRLDDVLAERPPGAKPIKFVKIDVEGYECQVLKGGMSLLTKHRPALFMSEVWTTLAGCTVKEYLDLFRAANYTITIDAHCVYQVYDDSFSRMQDLFMCDKPPGPPRPKRSPAAALAGQPAGQEGPVTRWRARAAQAAAEPLTPLAYAGPAGCPLPAGGRWCRVQVRGLPPFDLAVHAGGHAQSARICRTGVSRDLRDAAELRLLGEPGLALDVGGGVGLFAFAAAQANWSVTVFEPDATRQALLEASLCANPSLRERVEVHGLALGADSRRCWLVSSLEVDGPLTRCGGELELEYLVDAEPGTAVPVDVHRLDEVLAARPPGAVHLVRLGAGDFSCQVMMGAQSLLTKYRPNRFLSEVPAELEGCAMEDFFEIFTTSDYSVSMDPHCRAQASRGFEGTKRLFMCPAVPKRGAAAPALGHGGASKLLVSM